MVSAYSLLFICVGKVRGVCNIWTERRLNFSKPHTLDINFRSHQGVLRCAKSVLDFMFECFPSSIEGHTVDEGLCLGPRPVYFLDLKDKWQTDISQSRLRSILTHNNKVTVLCRDEFFLSDPETGMKTLDNTSPFYPILHFPEQTNSPHYVRTFGIKEAKGMEYDHVVILDFFSTAAPEQQEWWVSHFNYRIKYPQLKCEISDKFPHMEMQLKLLYTAITRCKKRLLFVETEKTKAYDAFERWVGGIPEKNIPALVEKLAKFENNDIGFTSNDEWKSEGINLAIQASEEHQGAMFRALEFFNRAGASPETELLKFRAQTTLRYYRMVNNIRTEILKSPQLEHSLVTEIVALIKDCIELNLINEADRLCEIIAPYLGLSDLQHKLFESEIQQKLKLHTRRY